MLPTPPAELCRPGYAVLTHSNSWWTNPIEWATGKVWRGVGWKHTAIFTYNHLLVEAVGSGVRLTALSDLLVGCSAAAIVKPRLPFTVEDEKAMVQFVDLIVAESVGYDWWAIWTWLTRRLQSDARMMCAELVFAAWDELLRFNRAWPLPGARRYTPCPNDVWRLGRLVWPLEDARVQAVGKAARKLLTKKGR